MDTLALFVAKYVLKGWPRSRRAVAHLLVQLHDEVLVGLGAPMLFRKLFTSALLHATHTHR